MDVIMCLCVQNIGHGCFIWSFWSDLRGRLPRLAITVSRQSAAGAAGAHHIHNFERILINIEKQRI